MRVFLDENMPRQLRQILDGHVVSFVENEGWKGKQNGELLSLVEKGFDVLVTSDGNLEFQNELTGRALSLIVLPTNNLTLLRANAIAVRQLVDDLLDLEPPVIVTVGWKGDRRLQRPGSLSREPSEIASISGFGRAGDGKQPPR